MVLGVIRSSAFSNSGSNGFFLASISDISVMGGAEGRFTPVGGSRDIDHPIDYKADHIVR